MDTAQRDTHSKWYIPIVRYQKVTSSKSVSHKKVVVKVFTYSRSRSSPRGCRWEYSQNNQGCFFAGCRCSEFGRVSSIQAVDIWICMYPRVSLCADRCQLLTQLTQSAECYSVHFVSLASFQSSHKLVSLWRPTNVSVWIWNDSSVSRRARSSFYYSVFLPAFALCTVRVSFLLSPDISQWDRVALTEPSCVLKGQAS